MLDRRYIKHKYSDKYSQILSELQKTQNATYWKMNQEESSSHTDKKIQMTSYVKRFLKDRAYSIPDYTDDELAEKLVNDIEFFSILTTPLNDPEVEGININSFEDVRVTFRNGVKCKIDGFQSPTHAIDIMKRLLLVSGKTLDNATPTAEASIRWSDGRDIRITVLQYPIVDKDVGACGYIRKLSKKVFTTEEYLQCNFAVKDELKLLRIALRRGVSMLLVGKVNTGKTTFLNYLMSKLPIDEQVVTIETGARELNLIRHDKNGNIISNAVHLLTRPSNIEEQNITQEKLIESVLRLNADAMAVAEMRNDEAYAAQEASLVGTAVISTTHAGSPQQAHERVAELCRKRYMTDMQNALITAQKAFPIVAFIHTPIDGKRRIVNLSECRVVGQKAEYIKLYEFVIDNASGISIGTHKKVNNVSDDLIEHMKLYGLTLEEEKFLRGEKK